MSSISSAVSADSVSASSEPECEPSLSVKSTPSVRPSSESDGSVSAAIQISASSQQHDWLEMESTSISSAEDSPAKTSASQGKAQVWQERAAVYGRSSPELLAKYDPVSRSWKTSQCCLDEGLDKFSETWPRSGMTRNGIAYQLPPLAPLTNETESGLWPTPVTLDTGARFNRSASKGAKLRPTLGAMAKHGLWPTPTTVSGNNCGQLQEWGGARSRRMISHLPKSERSGPLNPTFPEWLMGFPLGWTALDPLEIPSSRKSRKSSGGQS